MTQTTPKGISSIVWSCVQKNTNAKNSNQRLEESVLIHVHSTTQILSRKLIFAEGGKPENPEKKTSESD